MLKLVELNPFFIFLPPLKSVNCKRLVEIFFFIAIQFATTVKIYFCIVLFLDLSLRVWKRKIERRRATRT